MSSAFPVSLSPTSTTGKKEVDADGAGGMHVPHCIWQKHLRNKEEWNSVQDYMENTTLAKIAIDQSLHWQYQYTIRQLKSPSATVDHSLPTSKMASHGVLLYHTGGS